MNKSEFLKHLRELIGEGRTEEALDFFKTHIEHFATYFSNDIVMLKSQFISAKNQFLLKGVIENAEFARIVSKVNLAILEIADKIEKQSDHLLGIQRRGHLLHKIPSKMVKEKETKCIIRIAYTLEQLLIGLTIDNDTIFQAIQVTGLMSVELIDDNQTKIFEIRTSTDEEQFIIHEECTQWIFKVRPLRIGNFPLLLKIGAVEVINGKERKRNIIIEKEIQIIIESSEIEDVKFSLINLEDEYYFGASRLLTLRRLIELERVKNEKSEKFEEEKRKWKIEEESEIFIYEDRQIEMCKPSINILSRRNLRKSNRLVILAIIVLLILIAIFILKRI